MTILNTENIELCRDKISFSYEKEKVTETVDSIVNEIKKDLAYKGFRKGKVPPEIIKNIAKNFILEETKKKLANEAFDDILFQNKYKPFGEPEVKNIDVSYNKFVMDINVGYYPTFELTQYKDFELDSPDSIPSDTELRDRVLSDVKKQNPDIVLFTEDDFAMDGDSIVVDYISTIDGKEFSGNKGEGIMIELGKGEFMRDFEVNVLGMKLGESREFDVVFEKDHKSKELAGKNVHFVTKLTNGVKKKDPDITEEFVKKSGFSSMEEFDRYVDSNIHFLKEGIARDKLKNIVIEKLLSVNNIEVPQWMVVKTAKFISKTNGLDFDKCDDKVKESMVVDAEKSLKVNFIFEKIREKEVEAVLSQEEINQVIKQNMGKFPPKIQKELQASSNNKEVVRRLYSEIQDEHVLAWVIGKSKIVKKMENDNGTQKE